MERTEELHLIHKQLDFNRMKVSGCIIAPPTYSTH